MMFLIVENLRVSYGQIRALHGIILSRSTKVRSATIIGANGAGKSTTLRAISRMVPVEPGSKMTYLDQNLLDFSVPTKWSAGWAYPTCPKAGVFSAI